MRGPWEKKINFQNNN
uniref:Uncharacterized protein n=1 Tax=Anguilla anguilla TaxID=7936 RepID=A0A0E9RX82_ANGAN